MNPLKANLKHFILHLLTCLDCEKKNTTVLCKLQKRFSFIQTNRANKKIKKILRSKSKLGNIKKYFLVFSIKKKIKLQNSGPTT